MGDDPTVGEVGRRLDALAVALRDEVHDLTKQLGDRVPAQVAELRHQAIESQIIALQDQVKTIKELREKDAARLAANRRWLVGAIVVPSIAILVPVLLALLGVHT